MEPRSPQFESILDDVAADYAAAEIMNTWLPEDDGDYDCLVMGYNEGETVKEDFRMVWVNLTLQLATPHLAEIDEREFVSRYTSAILFRLKEDVAAIAGKKVDNIRESLNVLRGVVGQMVRVNISTSKPNKKGQTFRNAKITQVLESVPA